MPGYYETVTRIKPDAKPIDNKTKFAWDDDDYEEVEEWHEYTEEELEMLNTPGLEDIIAEQDDAICSLYEESLQVQSDMDDAICALYEMIEGGV